MPKLKPTAIAILTANDLRTGEIVYWTGAGWSPPPEAAARAGDPDGHAALAAKGEAEEAANTVVSVAVIALDLAGVPTSLREQRRMAGPSIALPQNVALSYIKAA